MDNLPPVAAPSPKHKTPLIKAGYGQCRFLVSEPPAGAICCGAPTEDGSSWCTWHRRVVYVKPRERSAGARRGP
jgi:hypothetical protein